MRQFLKSTPVKVFAVILAALLFGAVFASVSQNDTSPVTKVVSVVFTPLQMATSFLSEKLHAFGASFASANTYRTENEALRRENQMLRRELISKNGALPDSVMPEKGVASDEGLEPAEKETGYWLSSKTKVRHNKRCRNYRRVKGMPCGPNDGRPCKACGG